MPWIFVRARQPLISSRQPRTALYLLAATTICNAGSALASYPGLTWPRAKLAQAAATHLRLPLARRGVELRERLVHVLVHLHDRCHVAAPAPSRGGPAGQEAAAAAGFTQGVLFKVMKASRPPTPAFGLLCQKCGKGAHVPLPQLQPAGPLAWCSCKASCPRSLTRPPETQQQPASRVQEVPMQWQKRKAKHARAVAVAGKRGSDGRPTHTQHA